MSANNQAIFRPLRVGELDSRTYQNSHAHVNKKWLFEKSATSQLLLRDEVKSEGYYLRNRAQLRLPKRFREQASRRISKADRHQNAASKKAQNNEQPRPYLHLHNRSGMGPLQQQRLRHIAKKAIAYMQDHSIEMPQENRFGGLPIGTQLYSWVKVEGA